MYSFQATCERLGVPIAQEKTEGPVTTITFLGLEIDSVIDQLLPCLTRVCTSYEAVLFKVCFTVAFFGFLRVGEFTGISRSATGANLRINDVVVRRQSLCRHLRLFFRSSKTDQLARGCYIIIPEAAGSPLCPVDATVNHLAVMPHSGEAFFCAFDGRQLTRRAFTEVLRKCLSFLNLRFASHSFRIGAATSAAMAGFDVSAIQRMGRWATDTHTRYVRINMLDEL
ncbi:uncharacterized protein [Diadema setosum]|uniref:uncharacterized protein n=1 Tax=Diadema setosum TaxID=31175 RepID=UPI003B3BBEBD